jgi:hypothetical protein
MNGEGYLRGEAAGDLCNDYGGSKLSTGHGKYMDKAERGKVSLLCKATTLKIKTRERTRTTTGSTFNPGDSSVYSPIWHVSYVMSWLYDSAPFHSVFIKVQFMPVSSPALPVKDHTRIPPFHITVALAFSDNRALKRNRCNSLNMVLLLPPAPAARVELGLAFATLSF